MGPVVEFADLVHNGVLGRHIHPHWPDLMNRRAIPLILMPLVVTCLAACEKQELPVQKMTYVDDVGPILEEHCVECHLAGKKGAESSGLLMESYETLMKGSRFGRVIEPGSATTSSLYIIISGKARLTVSMPHGTEPMSDEEIETIRVWIEEGAIEN